MNGFVHLNIKILSMFSHAKLYRETGAHVAVCHNYDIFTNLLYINFAIWKKFCFRHSAFQTGKQNAQTQTCSKNVYYVTLEVSSNVSYSVNFHFGKIDNVVILLFRRCLMEWLTGESAVDVRYENML